MKNIISIVVCMLFFGIIFSQITLAGDENDPEFTDAEKDVKMWFFFKGPLDNALFSNLDIVSCWFHENPEDTNNFYITIKIKHIRFGFFNTTYIVMWEYNDQYYSALCRHRLFSTQVYADIRYAMGSMLYIFETIAEADIVKNTITITVPKNYVGNISAGDVLSKATITTALLPNQIKFLELFPMLSLIAYDEIVDGRDYTIQY